MLWFTSYGFLAMGKGVIVVDHHHDHLLPHEVTILTLQFEVRNDNITLSSFESKTFKPIKDCALEDRPHSQPQP